MNSVDSVPDFLKGKSLDALPPPYREAITKVCASMPCETVKHEDYDRISRTILGYYDDFKGWMKEEMKEYCQYAFVGMYSPDTYSSGRMTKVLDVARFYIVWTYIDDVIDATTSINDMMAVCASTKGAISASHQPTFNDGAIVPHPYMLFFRFLLSTREATSSLYQVAMNNGVLSPKLYTLFSRLFLSIKGAIFGPRQISTNDSLPAPELYKVVSKFFHSDEWDSELLPIAKSMFLKYIDHTMVCRINEIEQRAMLPQEYYLLRSFNVGVPLAHVLHWYTNPELDTRALKDEDVIEALILSGYTIGITLDLFNQNLKRPNKTTFANIYHVMRDTFGLSHEDTICKEAEELVRNEIDFWGKMKDVSSKFPREARAISKFHANTYRWILGAKLRYKQDK